MLEYLSRPVAKGDWLQSETTGERLWLCISSVDGYGIFCADGRLIKLFSSDHVKLVSKESVAEAIGSTSDVFYDGMIDEYNEKYVQSFSAEVVKFESDTFQRYDPGTPIELRRLYCTPSSGLEFTTTRSNRAASMNWASYSANRLSELAQEIYLARRDDE